ncbi:MAG: VOC family protein [Gammaproteobacteria bacterium]|nr:MAG: VOC family protein [Gammaproteobacteria bacterium]
MAPTLANGKICHLELPAVDITRSAAFYTEVFRWSMRKRGDGATAFDDTTGEVSGAFVTGRKASPPGVLFYIMVDSVEATCRAVEAHGGSIVQPIGADRPEITARFRDPGGNIIGLYQQPSDATR